MPEPTETTDHEPEASIATAADPPRSRDTVNRDTTFRSRPTHGLLLPSVAFLVSVGGALQGYANSAMDAPVVALLMLLFGAVLVAAFFPRRHAEIRAFLLTYAICVLSGGLAQWYASALTGTSQSFVDATGFFDAIIENPPYYTWEELKTLWIDGAHISRGAPLAVAIWQWVYRASNALGFTHAPYVGVMFNGLVMGWTAAVTVGAARELFGDDPWRLRRAGTLFAFCGLFVLFGAILIRDCFTTFLNAVVLYGILRALCRPSTANLSLAGVLTGLSVLGMMYLRSRSIVLFGLYWALAGGCWFISHRLDAKRILIAIVALPVVMASLVYLAQYLQVSAGLQSHYQAAYGEIISGAVRDDSIAMRLVVNQPLPIRLLLGTGSLMVFPIPFWAYFRPESGEYLWIKGYNGLYQIFVMPLVIAGCAYLWGRVKRDPKGAIPFLFLGVYLAMNTLAVVATSLEQRHLAQFLPAFMVLAAAMDTRTGPGKRFLAQSVFIWVALVVSVHLAWYAVASGR